MNWKKRKRINGDPQLSLIPRFSDGVRKYKVRSRCFSRPFAKLRALLIAEIIDKREESMEAFKKKSTSFDSTESAPIDRHFTVSINIDIIKHIRFILQVWKGDVILDVIDVAEVDDFDLSREWYDWVGQYPFQGLPHQDPRNHIEELEDLVSMTFLYKIFDDAEATRENEKNDKWDKLVESWQIKRKAKIPRQLLDNIMVEGDKQHGYEELSREEAETNDPTSASINTTTSTSTPAPQNRSTPAPQQRSTQTFVID
ncbi:hypothetical protein F2Q70_00017579 [Brassica cretica]|uniref:Uncharacterized protein n=1 Tax=Brassica cretica TaxID=69181 RepID=A0A8S9KVM6_BRACR|nr:hypothetical protein F2Q70_00017579 [Brassica cretica]KAF2598449.1 hypothetical protein F2Q68_00010519 [Brassica cretica]